MKIMKKRGLTRWLIVLAVFAVVATACSSTDDSSSTETTAAATDTTAAGGDSGSEDLTKVKLQLQWFTQAQFAGYFAALDHDF